MDEVCPFSYLEKKRGLKGTTSINIFIWAVALIAHAGCKSFGSLLAVRFILGMCEGVNNPVFGLVLVQSHMCEQVQSLPGL